MSQKHQWPRHSKLSSFWPLMAARVSIQYQVCWGHSRGANTRNVQFNVNLQDSVTRDDHFHISKRVNYLFIRTQMYFLTTRNWLTDVILKLTFWQFSCSSWLDISCYDLSRVSGNHTRVVKMSTNSEDMWHVLVATWSPGVYGVLTPSLCH